MIVEYGETISEELSAISIDQNGLIFNGWYLDDALFDPDSPITESITLQANIIADPAPNYHFVTCDLCGRRQGLREINGRRRYES